MSMVARIILWHSGQLQFTLRRRPRYICNFDKGDYILLNSIEPYRFVGDPVNVHSHVHQIHVQNGT